MPLDNDAIRLSVQTTAVLMDGDLALSFFWGGGEKISMASFS